MQTNNKEYLLFSGNEILSHVAPKVRQVLSLNKFRKAHEPLFSLLSEREREVLILLSKGFSNPGVAKKLRISRYTVQNHRKHINKKLCISHYRDLYKYAWAFRMISFETD